jgi:serine/threonine-protein kinase RsbW
MSPAARRRAGRARERSRPTPDPASVASSAILSLPSETSFLGLVREVTKRMAEVAGFEATVADQVALAVDEATTNVMKHAYAGRRDARLELRFEDRGPALCVDILDRGAAFDPKSLPEVDVARYERERRRGGLGVHLMGKIMDSATFRRSLRRNVCCLVKRKPAAVPRG